MSIVCFHSFFRRVASTLPFLLLNAVTWTVLLIVTVMLVSLAPGVAFVLATSPSSSFSKPCNDVGHFVRIPLDFPREMVCLPEHAVMSSSAWISCCQRCSQLWLSVLQLACFVQWPVHDLIHHHQHHDRPIIIIIMTVATTTTAMTIATATTMIIIAITITTMTCPITTVMIIATIAIAIAVASLPPSPRLVVAAVMLVIVMD
ncbi:hypothetical protein E2542_SST25859 [Spatholobus suberectus]|nr:hypothetical protein E2542_SST25859 [Spatholobus suberectus]